jgi:hypothetical protein
MDETTAILAPAASEQPVAQSEEPRVHIQHRLALGGIIL